MAFGLSGLSGFLFFSAFPPFNQGELAFIALIPFVFALRLYSAASCRMGYFAGLVCWIPSLWFLSPVTIPGAMLLAAYCALYWVPVAWGWGRFMQNWSAGRPLLSLRMVIGGAGWWCAMEHLRGWFLTGFPWNDLGVSQWENYSLMQIASLGGVLMLSFLLVALNLGIALSIMVLFESMGKRQPRRMHPELYLPVLLLVCSFSWGSRELRRLIQVPERSLRVGVVQPLASNKWSEELANQNFRVLWELSDAALSLNPDLMVWPETAVPEMLRDSRTTQSLVQSLVKDGTPLLLGSMDFETRSDGEQVEVLYYNSVFMVDGSGSTVADYRKKHLVMFGEYLPFGKYLPFLRSLTPMPEDVTPGNQSGVLPLPGSDLNLGMLICFEDLIPGLSADLVKEGSDLFVNQTNDAWFDPLWGSTGHLAHAVFRSVEQRRPMVRATNSGVSAWIDTRGVVRDVIEDPKLNKRDIRGFKIFEVLTPTNPETSVYHQYAWAFPLFCWVSGLLLIRRRIGKN
ncbi:apolipoprotein N-acyltransferase [Kiritimatiellaeota bacterium B1221]|nr:apolipoprotein N-acyltransferase [Kiritimatiellaeota bacterium B1221]